MIPDQWQRETPLWGAGSGEDVVEEELREEQNTEDDTMTPCQQHILICYPLLSQLTAQSHQVPAGRERESGLSELLCVSQWMFRLLLLLPWMCLIYLWISCCVFCIDVTEASIKAMSFISLVHRAHWLENAGHMREETTLDLGCTI